MPGSENLSDLFTKALDGETIDKHVYGTNCEFTEGKDDLAFTIHFVGADSTRTSSATRSGRRST